jgi:hypothetical protein
MDMYLDIHIWAYILLEDYHYRIVLEAAIFSFFRRFLVPMPFLLVCMEDSYLWPLCNNSIQVNNPYHHTV